MYSSLVDILVSARRIFQGDVNELRWDERNLRRSIARANAELWRLQEHIHRNRPYAHRAPYSFHFQQALSRFRVVQKELVARQRQLLTVQAKQRSWENYFRTAPKTRIVMRGPYINPWDFQKALNDIHQNRHKVGTTVRMP